MRGFVRLAAAMALAAASGGAAVAGVVVPAPLLGAGLPGLLVLGAAAGGYVAIRAYRRRR